MPGVGAVLAPRGQFCPQPGSGGEGADSWTPESGAGAQGAAGGGRRVGRERPQSRGHLVGHGGRRGACRGDGPVVAGAPRVGSVAAPAPGPPGAHLPPAPAFSQGQKLRPGHPGLLVAGQTPSVGSGDLGLRRQPPPRDFSARQVESLSCHTWPTKCRHSRGPGSWQRTVQGPGAPVHLLVRNRASLGSVDTDDGAC